MSNEALLKKFEQIEKEIKEICIGEHLGNELPVSLFDCLQSHGLGKGEPDNMLTPMLGYLQLFKISKKPLNQLLLKWSKEYSIRADIFEQKRYIPRIRELTKKIYSDDEEAEHIVRKLESISNTRKEKKFEKKITSELENIKKKCQELMGVAYSVQELINELKEHSRKLEHELESAEAETLLDKEKKYLEKITDKMRNIGKKGWDITLGIYSEEEKAEHIFRKLRKYMFEK